MRTISAVLFLAFLLNCSSQARAQAAPSCGPANVEFDVKTTSGQHPIPGLEPGKALVFFLQDDLLSGFAKPPTTLFGVDGAWVGATRANSFFYVFVDPGQHHLCVDYQSHKQPHNAIEAARSMVVAHFTAQAGQTYYFRVRDIGSFYMGSERELSPLDSDEAKVLVSAFSLSSSHPKK